MEMVPAQARAETDVIGRHGRIGVETFPRDLDVGHMPLPVEIGREYVELVDDMDRRVETMLRAEQAAGAEVRRAQIAVADTVQVDSVA